MESELESVVVSEVANGLAEDVEKNAEEGLETEPELVMAGQKADKDDAFEFRFDCSDIPSSPVSADVVFCDWRMKQSFPLTVSSAADQIEEEAEEEARAEDVSVSDNVGVGSSRRAKTPLRQLMEVEKAVTFSCSSSEANGVTPLTAGSYVVSNPAAGAENGRKLKPTSLCKRWSLRNLIQKGGSVHEESGGGGRKKETKRHCLLPFKHVGLLAI